MSYRPILAVLALLCCACTDHERSIVSLIAPSTKQQPAPTTGPVSVPGTVSTSGPTLQAPWFTIMPKSCLPPCTLKWVLEVTQPAPQRFHLVAVSHHSDTAGTAMTDERPGPDFRFDGSAPQTDYAVGSTGTTVVMYDTQAHVCGRAQLDLGMVFEGRAKPDNVLGVVYDYQVNCDPPPPDCTVTGTCPPPPCTNAPCQPPVAWQSDLVCGGFTPGQDITTIADMDALGARLLASDGTDDSQESPTVSRRHQQVCDGVVVDADVVRNVATIRVDDPAPQLVVSLLMFRKNGVSWVPQVFVSGESLAITAPGVYSLTVKAVQ